MTLSPCNALVLALGKNEAMRCALHYTVCMSMCMLFSDAAFSCVMLSEVAEVSCSSSILHHLQKSAVAPGLVIISSRR